MDEETRDLDNEETSQQSAVRDQDADLDKALERVYRKYGPNLGLFFKDVQEELSLKRQDVRGAKHHSSSR